MAADDRSTEDDRPRTTATDADNELSLEEQQRYALIRSLRKESGAEEFVRSISQQLLLKNDSNWGELLGAAPAALCCLGQTFVAATSSTAISSLELSTKGTLEHATLRANLVRCSDLGREAFMEAESKMHRVSIITNAICQPNGTIDKILRLIDNEKLAKMDLQRQLDRLKGFSEDCTNDAKEVHTKFKAWQDYALKIREACVSADDKIGNKRHTVRDKIQVVEMQKDYQQEEVERMEIEVNEWKEHRDTHKQAYKHAQKVLPTGWNAVAQQCAGDFMNNAFGLMTQVGSLKSLLNVGRFSRQERQSEDSHYSRLLPNPNDDYGYVVAGKISRHLHGLKTCLWYSEVVSPDYGVDWNTLYGFHRSMSGAYQPPGISIDVALAGFKEAADFLDSVRIKTDTSSKALQEAADILNMAIQVAEEIHTSKEQQTVIQTSMQPRNKGNINVWREKIRMACERIDGMENQRRAALQLFESQLKETKEKVVKKPKKAPQKWDNLSFARENYRESQRALKEAEDRLAERVVRDAETKTKFNEIQLELKRLGNEDLNIAQIIHILKKCVDRLTQFQVHLGKLIQFFDGLNNFISMINDNHAKEFLAQVDNVIKIEAMNEHEDEYTRKKDKKYFADSLLVDALQLRGHYLVAGELATVYVEVSRKHIMPGVNEIDRLALSANATGSIRAGEAKVKAIQTYARKAQSEIYALAVARQTALRKEYLDQERQFEEIGSLIRGLEGQMQGNEEDAVKYDDEWDSE